MGCSPGAVSFSSFFSPPVRVGGGAEPVEQACRVGGIRRALRDHRSLAMRTTFFTRWMIANVVPTYQFTGGRRLRSLSKSGYSVSSHGFSSMTRQRSRRKAMSTNLRSKSLRRVPRQLAVESRRNGSSIIKLGVWEFDAGGRSLDARRYRRMGDLPRSQLTTNHLNLEAAGEDALGCRGGGLGRPSARRVRRRRRLSRAEFRAQVGRRSKIGKLLAVGQNRLRAVART